VFLAATCQKTTDREAPRRGAMFDTQHPAGGYTANANFQLFFTFSIEKRTKSLLSQNKIVRMMAGS
jgi:hypothetical protein